MDSEKNECNIKDIRLHSFHLKNLVNGILTDMKNAWKICYIQQVDFTSFQEGDIE